VTAIMNVRMGLMVKEKIGRVLRERTGQSRRMEIPTKKERSIKKYKPRKIYAENFDQKYQHILSQKMGKSATRSGKESTARTSDHLADFRLHSRIQPA